jgi:hypothetical protein
MTTLQRAVENALAPLLGSGPHVAALTSPYISFTPEALARLAEITLPKAEGRVLAEALAK